MTLPHALPADQTFHPQPAGDDLARYHRQMLLPGIGIDGQRRLAASRALLVGCGALGSVVAEALVRAGIGELVLIDRDVVEWTNLQRQVLYDESDAAAGLPKAEAAAAKLAAINSQVRIHPIPADVTHRNIRQFTEGCDLIIDGTDNFATRFLLNDAAVKFALPLVYGGAVGTRGMVHTVLTGQAAQRAALPPGPCLRCLFGDAPGPGVEETCDRVGVLGPAAGWVGNLQAAEAIKLLSGNAARLNRRLLSIDLWTNEFRALDVSHAMEGGTCPCCALRRFDHLQPPMTPDHPASAAAGLCGRNAVQIIPAGPVRKLDLKEMARRLEPFGAVTATRFMVRLQLAGAATSGAEAESEARVLTLFADGRAIIQGLADPGRARSLYARLIGE